jgi:hypothetical protein
LLSKPERSSRSKSQIIRERAPRPFENKKYLADFDNKKRRW